MNPTLKRYLVSSGVTFLSIFLVTFGTAVGGVDTMSALSASTIIALAVAAMRAAVKGAVETLTILLKTDGIEIEK